MCIVWRHLHDKSLQNNKMFARFCLPGRAYFDTGHVGNSESHMKNDVPLANILQTLDFPAKKFGASFIKKARDFRGHINYVPLANILHTLDFPAKKFGASFIKTEHVLLKKFVEPW